MKNPSNSTVDPGTGNVRYSGPLEITKGDHGHMPARSEAYLPGDERGHVNASSLGGTNTTSNVVAQHSDVNHGAYYSMEQGERAALQDHAEIQSEKTAVVNGEAGDRPQAFMVSDTVTYADGHSEAIHHSFANESYADQAAWNAESAQLPGAMEEANPGDGLRDSLHEADYAELMESTDAELPGIQADYAPADFSGLPSSDLASTASESAAESSADADTGSGISADAGGDSGGIAADPD